MKALCKKLGYTFSDMKLLETALTHPSFGGDHHVPHYQRLEFLGDAVLELGKFIRLSVGEDRSGGRDKPSILCDVMEAVLAAVYLDGGFDCAVDVIRRALGDELHPEMLEDHLDAKSRLQEVLQRDGEMPVYVFISMEGPPHAPLFRYSVTLNGQQIGVGDGTSKQNAQQEAARDALRRMRNGKIAPSITQNGAIQ